MWYFTGKGDAGKTSLFDGSSVKKDDPILELLGAIDEINSYVGLGRSKLESDDLNLDLLYLQTSLSKLMGLIAGASAQSLFDFTPGKLLEWLEAKIKIYSKDVLNPKEFTFPGTTELGSIFDICRTVSRRTERIAVRLSGTQKKLDSQILTVLNRLSSYFYIIRLTFE